MSDRITRWLDERQMVHAAATDISEARWFASRHHVCAGIDLGDPDEIVGTLHEKEYAAAVVDAHNHFPAALAAIEAVLALHRPESRFVVLGYEDVSFSSVEDAEEFVGGPVDDAEEFKLCVECKRVEDGADHNTEEIGYETSLYPCKTRRALEGVIDNE